MPNEFTAGYLLIYFKGCPNFEIAKDLLNEVGIEYQLVCQDDLQANHFLRNFTSPTLLEDGEIVFGHSLLTGNRARTMAVPTEFELLSLIYENEPESD